MDISTVVTSDMERLNEVLEEKTASPRLMWLGQDTFGNIYRYMMRYLHRYRAEAYKMLITVKTKEGDEDINDIRNAALYVGGLLRNSLRYSDLMMQTNPTQFFLLLPELSSKDVDTVVDRIYDAWYQGAYSVDYSLVHELEQVKPAEE